MAFIDEQGRRFDTIEARAKANPTRFAPDADPANMSRATKAAFDAQKGLATPSPETNIGSVTTDPTKKAEAVTTSSTELRNDVSTNTAQINGIADIESAGAQSISASNKQYDEQISAYEKRLEADLKAIEQQFASARQGLESQQANEKGTTGVGLARIGGFLGGSASETGTMLSLAKSHRNEISLLESSKIQAIQAAKNANEDKRFLLAQQKLEDVKQIQADIEDRKQAFIDMSLQIEQDNLDRKVKLFDFDKKQADVFAENALNQLTGDVEVDSQMLIDMAKNAGISDPNVLRSAILSLNREISGDSQSESEELLSVNEAANLNVPYGTTKGEAFGTIPKSEFTTQQEFTNTNNMRSKLLTESKDFQKVRDSYSRIVASVDDPSAAGDLALIFNFMKTLDPGSVVRESEFATAANAGGIDDKIRATYNKVLNGKRLSEKQRKDFVDRAKKLYDSQVEVQRNREDEARRTALDFGLDPNLAVPSQLFEFSSSSSSGEYEILDETFSGWGDDDIRELEEAAQKEGRMDEFNQRFKKKSKTLTSATGTVVKGSLAEKNNNPGNLRFVGQKGGSQGVGGFARFPTMEAGIQALKNDLLAKIEAGGNLGPDNTLLDLANIYAPAEDDNDPNGWAANVASFMGSGVTPRTKLRDLEGRIDDFVLAVARKESSFKPMA